MCKRKEDVKMRKALCVEKKRLRRKGEDKKQIVKKKMAKELRF
jgi:hypothetical protein